MIGRIRGILLEKRPPWLLLDVQGVGYELEAPMSTFYRLPELHREVSLYTHLLVREDAHLLFGFSSEAERELFRDLLKVSGIGARTALAILSGMDAAQFAQCVQEGDLARLRRLPGIGKKTAERLIVEMRDRLKGRLATEAWPAPESATGQAFGEAVSALIALGYRSSEALRCVRGVARAGMSSEAIIREALRSLARGATN